MFWAIHYLLMIVLDNTLIIHRTFCMYVYVQFFQAIWRHVSQTGRFGKGRGGVSFPKASPVLNSGVVEHGSINTQCGPPGCEPFS